MATTERKRILVVDDNESIRNLIVLMLDNPNYEVLALSSGQQALSVISDFSPDLVLLDVMMPQMSGIEVLTAIRNSRKQALNEVPVVMITAKSLTTDIDKAIELGATSYIVKPFRSHTLINLVAKSLSLN